MKSKLRIGSKEFNIADEGARKHVGYVEPSDTAGTPSLAYELSADGTYYIVTGRGTVKGSEIVIPDTYEGKPVREVAVKAFYGDEEITKITVGANVTYIGGGAIVCPNLAVLYFTMTPEIAVEYLQTDSIDNLYSCGYFITCEEHDAVLDDTQKVYSIYGYDVDILQGNCAARFLEYAENTECFGEQWDEETAHTITAEDVAIKFNNYA